MRSPKTGESSSLKQTTHAQTIGRTIARPNLHKWKPALRPRRCIKRVNSKQTKTLAKMETFVNKQVQDMTEKFDFEQKLLIGEETGEEVEDERGEDAIKV